VVQRRTPEAVRDWGFFAEGAISLAAGAASEK
jgi:hypothetical protein